MSNEITLAQKMALLSVNLDAAQDHLKKAWEVAVTIQQDIGKLSELSALLGSLKDVAKPKSEPRKRRTKEEMDAEKRRAETKGAV